MRNRWSRGAAVRLKLWSGTGTRYVVLQWLLCVLIVFAGCKGSSAEVKETATVGFYPHDHDGNKLPYRVAEFRREDTNVDFAGSFGGGLEGNKIPFGRYTYVLRRVDIARPQMSNISGRVEIKESDHWILAQTRGAIFPTADGGEAIADFGEPVPIEVPARLVGYRPTGQTWIEAQKTFTGERLRYRIRPDGTVPMRLPYAGSYVVSVYESGKLLHTSPLEIHPGKPQNEIRIELVKR